MRLAILNLCVTSRFPFQFAKRLIPHTLNYTEIKNLAMIELVALIIMFRHRHEILPQDTRGLVSSGCFLLLHHMKQTHNKVRRYTQATKIRRHSCENTAAARMRHTTKGTTPTITSSTTSQKFHQNLK